MAATQDFDLPQAHRYFSAHCFNTAWELIEKPLRSEEERTQMVLRAMASLWHWSQRSDCTTRSLSVGYWQVSRVFSLAGYGSMALEMGEECLKCSADEGPFYVAYAHEAIARAASVLNERSSFEKHLKTAIQLADSVEDTDVRKQLLDDLTALSEWL